MKKFKVQFQYTASAMFEAEVEAESEEQAIEQVEKHEYLAGCCDFNNAISFPNEEYEVDSIEEQA